MADDCEYTSVVKIKDFVEKRAVQIADLVKVVDNSLLVSGEVTKGPRTAAQRLPRHMRRRAMGYEIRRFPKGLRSFAAPYIISNHRKKPPSRYFRRRSRNLLQNYIRRQRKAVWLETHIWLAKRFHMVEKWGYRLPDRSFQRNYRPIYRNSMRHCTIRDKSYLNCFIITGPSQQYIIDSLNPFCNPAVSPTFAYKSSLSGEFEISTLLYKPGSYPYDLIGPARFLWSYSNGKSTISVWVHPSCREQFLFLLISHLSLVKVQNRNVIQHSLPKTFEEWLAIENDIPTNIYRTSDGSITVEDLKDQLVRLRLFGPKSLDIVKSSIHLVTDAEDQYINHHKNWNKLTNSNIVPDSYVFSLQIEDPRLALITPIKSKISSSNTTFENSLESVVPASDIWCRNTRMAALKKRLSDIDLNKLKSNLHSNIQENSTIIPILIVIRNHGTGKQEALDGIEIIAPTGFGRDLWIALQLRTAHASGIRDDLAAHLESECLSFPSDFMDSDAGIKEAIVMQKELEDTHLRRPHNRRVLHWKNNAIKFPFSFEFPSLISEWSGIITKQAYYLRDRRSLLQLKEWISGKGKRPDDLISNHPRALIPLKLTCIASGRPKRLALVCLPEKEDVIKIRQCQYSGKPFSLTEVTNKVDEIMDTTSNSLIGNEKEFVWKDVVSLDISTREKPVALKSLFPNNKNIDKNTKKKNINKKKREAKKRRVELKQQRLEILNEEETKKQQSSYRYAASRKTVGRVLRGDFSFSEARGIAMTVVPLCVLPEIVFYDRILLFRNISSKYYHPVQISILKHFVEL